MHRQARFLAAVLSATTVIALAVAATLAKAGPSSQP
jgi:hypothetical protein